MEMPSLPKEDLYHPHSDADLNSEKSRERFTLMKCTLVRSLLKSRTFLLLVGRTAELPAFADTVPACGMSTVFRRTKAVIMVTLLGVAIGFFAQEAKADAVTYTYIGGNFTSVHQAVFQDLSCVTHPCFWHIGDYLTGIATLDITPGVAASGIQATYLSINGFGDPRSGGTYIARGTFDVDASGNITEWNMGFSGCGATAPSHDCPIQFNITSIGPLGTDRISENLLLSSGVGPSGIWITPEPSTLLLLGFGVASIFGLKFRKASLAAKK